MDYQNLTKKQRKEMRRLQQKSSGRGKTILIWVGTITVGALAVIGLAFAASQGSNSQMQKLSDSFQGEDAEIISEDGVHWHPWVSIFIKGQKQEIPNNLGIGTSYSNNAFYDPMMRMTDIHTHSSDGVLHWEVMSGPVKKGHAKLKAFFDVWGKTFTSNQIFDAKNGQGGIVKMTVNGQPNNEFENYIVKDKDKIEIRFE